jgi:dolichol-phosphate mannosyltransferase subunit 3
LCVLFSHFPARRDDCFIDSSAQLPLWALVSLGAYLLFRLGWGIVTFNDVPEAHKELMVEIEQAKVELRKLGVTVD